MTKPEILQPLKGEEAYHIPFYQACEILKIPYNSEINDNFIKIMDLAFQSNTSFPYLIKEKGAPKNLTIQNPIVFFREIKTSAFFSKFGIYFGRIISLGQSNEFFCCYLGTINFTANQIVLEVESPNNLPQNVVKFYLSPKEPAVFLLNELELTQLPLLSSQKSS